MPEASADVSSLFAMNRSLYDRARDSGGTRLTTTAVPFSQADWRRHYGLEWEVLRKAKKRFDPNQILSPAQGMFLDCSPRLERAENTLSNVLWQSASFRTCPAVLKFRHAFRASTQVVSIRL